MLLHHNLTGMAVVLLFLAVELYVCNLSHLVAQIHFNNRIMYIQLSQHRTCHHQASTTKTRNSKHGMHSQCSQYLCLMVRIQLFIMLWMPALLRTAAITINGHVGQAQLKISSIMFFFKELNSTRFVGIFLSSLSCLVPFYSSLSCLVLFSNVCYSIEF